jgi:hypothetical protein
MEARRSVWAAAEALGVHAAPPPSHDALAIAGMTRTSYYQAQAAFLGRLRELRDSGDLDEETARWEATLFRGPADMARAARGQPSGGRGSGGSDAARQTPGPGDDQASGTGTTPGPPGGPAIADPDQPGTDAEFLSSCAQLASLLSALAGQVGSWAGYLAGQHLPQPALSPLFSAADALASAARHADQAGQAFRDAFDRARQAAASGLRITGHDTA